MSEDRHDFDAWETAVFGAAVSHLDGDPNPRADEVVQMNDLREQQGLEAFFLVVFTPNTLAKDGFDRHPWVIHEVEGEIVVDEAKMKMLPDAIELDF